MTFEVSQFSVLRTRQCHFNCKQTFHHGETNLYFKKVEKNFPLKSTVPDLPAKNKVVIDEEVN